MDLDQRKQEMYSSIEQWQATGLSQTAWCKQAGMSRSTFRKWLLRYEADHNTGSSPVEDSLLTSGSPSFVSIELPSRSGSQLTISYPNGVQLSCPASIGHDQLRHLVHLLD